tara:strand:+ start:358 stop:1278 length:921 start_codon:yes stop_codon:yes gene_type:complete
MNIYLENVIMGSSTGPNHFGAKLAKYVKRAGHFCAPSRHPIPDIQLSFIESHQRINDIPLVQRLDGIYFDIDKDYMTQNKNIIDTYNSANGIVFQSNYSKSLVFKYFGECKNYTVINNGADIELINSAKPVINRQLEYYDNIWCCASNWRGWKRMPDNIKYFLEFSDKKDCLIVAGMPLPHEHVNHERIFYIGQVSPPTLFSIFKISKYFIHLARYDACPNVVVDARAAGCHIICCSEGGTKEIAGKGATVVVEEPWDMNPVNVDSPPHLDFNNIIENDIMSDIDMANVANRYLDYLNLIMEKEKK